LSQKKKKKRKHKFPTLLWSRTLPVQSGKEPGRGEEVCVSSKIGKVKPGEEVDWGTDSAQGRFCGGRFRKYGGWPHTLKMHGGTLSG